jgi:MoxR-like ATPase
MLKPSAQKEKDSHGQKAVEIDEANGVAFILDLEMPLGPHFNSPECKLLRERLLKEYTLDQNTVAVIYKVASGVMHQEPTLLEGYTAASKTSAIEYLGAILGYKVCRLNLNGQTDTSELVGKFIPNDSGLAMEFEELIKNESNLSRESREILAEARKVGSLGKVAAQKIAKVENLKIPDWRWKDGLVPEAMKKGYWLILDEMNLAEAQILERLNSALEKHPKIVLSENGGLTIGEGGDFKTHENFRIFGTMNPADYAGRGELSPAYKNRWSNYSFIKSPGEKEYLGMLTHLITGKQPEITVSGEKYAGEPGEIHPELNKVRDLPNLELFLAKISKFHSEISKMAAERKIGKDKKEPYIFTRRDLLAFIAFISTHEYTIDRKTKEKAGLETHPKEIILRAIQKYYLDHLGGSTDDQKNVEDLLKTIGLHKDKFEIKFERESAKKIEKLKTDIRKKLGALNAITDALGKKEPDSGKSHEWSEAERKTIETIGNQYTDAILAFRKGTEAVNEINPKFTGYDIFKEDPMGRLYYETGWDEADSPETIQMLKKFEGRKFFVPTEDQLKSKLTPQLLQKFKEMEEAELEPKIVITPLALSIRSLAKKLDAEKGNISILTQDTFINNEINDAKLGYQPTEVKAAEDGQKLEMSGGKSKADLIEEHDGFLITVVSGVEEMKQHKDYKKEDYNGTQLERFHNDIKEKDEQGQIYEEYLAAEMLLLTKNIVIDKANWSALTGVDPKNTGLVPYGYWRVNRVSLRCSYASLQDYGLRCRSSVVVL